MQIHIQAMRATDALVVGRVFGVVRAIGEEILGLGARICLQTAVVICIIDTKFDFLGKSVVVVNSSFKCLWNT